MKNEPKYSIEKNMIYLTEKNVLYNERYSSKYCVLYGTNINKGTYEYNKEGLSTVIDWYRVDHKNEPSPLALKYKILFKGSDDEVLDRLFKIKQKNFYLKYGLYFIGDILGFLRGEWHD